MYTILRQAKRLEPGNIAGAMFSKFHNFETGGGAPRTFPFLSVLWLVLPGVMMIMVSFHPLTITNNLKTPIEYTISTTSNSYNLFNTRLLRENRPKNTIFNVN